MFVSSVNIKMAKPLKKLSANEINHMLMKVRTETELMMQTCWDEGKVALGWRHLVDTNGNRIRIDLFHAMINKELNIPSPLDNPAQNEGTTCNGFL